MGTRSTAQHIHGLIRFAATGASNGRFADPTTSRPSLPRIALCNRVRGVDTQSANPQRATPHMSPSVSRRSCARSCRSHVQLINAFCHSNAVPRVPRMYPGPLQFAAVRWRLG
mmetsp:Transcript_51575/g.152107  ORF Transcript_51575/g.152107 Transcript_51575/m.152107 type:complete len:113 (+) Transcript_51575:177-515(+)